jgi:hypothetical protein
MINIETLPNGIIKISSSEGKYILQLPTKRKYIVAYEINQHYKYEEVE